MIKVEVMWSAVWCESACGLCLDWCRSDAVCCFGTKITHTHTSVYVQLSLYKPVRTDLFLSVYLHFCDHSSFNKLSWSNRLRWTTWEASSVDSIIHQATAGGLLSSQISLWMHTKSTGKSKKKNKEKINRIKWQAELASTTLMHSNCR